MNRRQFIAAIGSALGILPALTKGCGGLEPAPNPVYSTITLIGTPQGPSPRLISRSLYRSNGGGPYTLIAVLDNNQTTYTDTDNHLTITGIPTT